MAVVYMDSFAHYATSDLARKGWTSNGTAAVIAGGGRFGSGALNAPNNVTGNGNATRSVPAGSTFVVGFAFRPTGSHVAASQLVTLLDAGTAQVDLRYNTDGTLSVTRNGTALTGGTSTATLLVGGWNHLEWRVTISNSVGANTCQVRLNGVVIITVATGQDVQNTANASANQVRVGAQLNPSATVTWSFSDLFVDDGTDFLGDMRVCYLAPTSAGTSTQWTATGAATGWDCVDDAAPDDDTTYVTSGTAGDLDLYNLADLPFTPTSVAAVQTVILHRKDDAGVRTIAPTVRSGGTNYDGSNTNVGDSYAYDVQVRTTDPATAAAWAVSSVNNLQLGPKVVA